MELAEAVPSETVSDIRASIQGPHGPIVFFQLCLPGVSPNSIINI